MEDSSKNLRLATKARTHKLSLRIKTLSVALLLGGAMLSMGLWGCKGGLPEGLGSLHEVVVLTDSTDWSACGDAVEATFGKTVQTPQREPIFALRMGDAAEFGFFKSWRNVFLLASLEGAGEATRLVRALLSPEVLERVGRGEAHVFFKTEVWAKDQILVIVAARDRFALRQKLVEEQDAIFTTMEDHLDRRMEQELYAEGEQDFLERALLEEFGWTLRIPEGYALERKLPEEGFVWLRKRIPERWLFVWWGAAREEIELNGEWCRKKRDEIGRSLYHGDSVAEILSVEEAVVAGKPAIKVCGLWENRERIVGGPFRSYSLVDRASGRVYMVDGAVYAPGIRKAAYLRQVDLIARTFSTKPPEPDVFDGR